MLLPEPLVPPDVDLRGYEHMPLFGARLYGSDFNAKVSDAGFRAALSLWWQAWNQVPAASLPNDEIILTRLADLARDLRSFRKIRVECLDGFIECSDGRLYHTELAKWAIVAWQKRLSARQRKEKWRAQQVTERGQDCDGTVPDSVTEPFQNADEAMVSEVKRSEAMLKNANSENPAVSDQASASNGQGAIQKKGKRKTANGTGQKWDDKPWVAATAATLGVQQRTGEDWTAYRDRVYAGVQQQLAKAKSHATRHAS